MKNLKNLFLGYLLLVISFGYSQQPHSGGIVVPTGFKITANQPVDDRTVVTSVEELDNLPNKYAGLICYVENNQGLYIYNGTEWLDVGSDSELVDSFINLSDITIVDNDITVSADLEWRINGIIYELTSNWTDTIPFATEGFTRKDIIVATNTGTLLRIEGDEDDENAVQPLTPTGTLLLTVIDVYGDFLGEPSEPEPAYGRIKKAGEKWRTWSIQAGGVSNMFLLESNGRNVGVYVYDAGGDFEYGTLGGMIADQPLQEYPVDNLLWDGCIVRIQHLPTTANKKLRIEHNRDIGTGAGVGVPFWFPNEEDYYYMEPYEILTFIYKKSFTVASTNGAFIFLASNMSSGDFIPPNTIIKNTPFYYPNWWLGERIPIFIENGIVKHKYSPEDVFFHKKIDKTIYYVSPSGNNSNDGLTPETAKASVINAYNAGGRYIKMLPGLYHRNSFLGTTALDLDGNDLIVEGLGNVYITHGHKNISWSSEGGSVYSANRASVVGIFDSKVIDSQGLFKMYIQKTSLEEVELEEYTWFQDGSTLYVNKPEGLPDNNLIVNVTLDTNNIYSDSGFFWYKNINFVGIRSTFRGKTSNSTLVGVIDNCTFNYPPSHPSEIYDTISFENVYHGVVYKTQVSNSIRDGLNYSSNLGLATSTFLEIDVTVKNVGNSTISSSANQTSTAHNGVKILRINGSYVSESGDTQLMADVNSGTQAILVGCELNSNSENLTINYYGCDSYLFACKLYGGKPVKADPASVNNVTVENSILDNKELSPNVIIIESL